MDIPLPDLDRHLVAQFQETTRSARRVIVGTHLNPDGDALGSALAVSHYLDALEVENEVVVHNGPPYNLKFLPGSDRIRHQSQWDDHDLAIVLDLDSLDRLGKVRETFESVPRMILIDHHIPHHEPGDLRIVDPTSPATALLLAELFLAFEHPISPAMATCLLTGIVTDTGSFRFRNTTPDSLAIAATLLKLGGDISLVSEEVYQKRPLAATRLMGFALENLQLSPDGRVCWSVLRLEDFDRLGASEEHTEGIVSELMAIDTVQIAALIREPKQDRVRASLRSRAGIDVASAAREFGGGGHKNAAGCTFMDESIDQVEQKLVQRLRQCLES
ncbi:MAG TPA: bifunctional oligoribonuclease/PAP phosphatase NrnA [Fimbriimonadaceae bacterium]|nr:bifunctional oligoribonuclease/PAP phosphatase NrnA [Fimbriimonadaceae bacterium]HRJ32722.1 bifunctional oligoribonuclease/PAP phosphatase NrnA [Fimbriimonadaceae bacterium]